MGLVDILKDQKLETDVWTTFEVIDSPATSVRIEKVERPFEEPQNARNVRRKYFLEELEATKGRLEEEARQKGESIELFIGDYDNAAPNGVPKALFRRIGEDTKRLNFDGPTTNYAQLRHDRGNFVVGVYPIAFSEWIACKTPDFTKAYEESVGKIPYAGIGISTVVESSDGFFILTQRGTGTPNYPGALFTLGGGLKPEDKVSKGLLNEIVEEAGLEPGKDYNLENIRVMAIGAEKSYAGGAHQRPEIVAYLKSNATWREIVNAQKKTEFQTDVAGLVPLDTEPINFASRVAVMGATGELLPAAEIGLVYAWLKKRENEVGVQQAIKETDILMRTLNQYTRQDYKPPSNKNF